MGNQLIVKIPSALQDYFKPQQKIEVFIDEKSKKKIKCEKPLLVARS